jgi:hypothetical protein
LNLLLLDMDGVLLRSWGYHRALQETVRLAGRSLGREDARLEDDQIAAFEALGITCEWHSSALCKAVMQLEQQAGKPEDGQAGDRLELEALFAALKAISLDLPPLQRAQSAIASLAGQAGLPGEPFAQQVGNSPSMQHSPTKNWFQELVLGSTAYQVTYRKPASLNCNSFLALFDEPLLSPASASRLKEWAAGQGNGAAIMTNRPSNSLPGSDGTPEAEAGAALVGLQDLPLVGLGEMHYLAERTGQHPGQVVKPAWPHALATLLAAGGHRLVDCLTAAGLAPENWQAHDLAWLEGARVMVFEDTPAGLLAVDSVARHLAQAKIHIFVQKVGVSTDPAKQAALAARGAQVFCDVNEALVTFGIT